jgi:hypothetical protein
VRYVRRYVRYLRRKVLRNVRLDRLAGNTGNVDSLGKQKMAAVNVEVNLIRSGKVACGYSKSQPNMKASASINVDSIFGQLQ